LPDTAEKERAATITAALSACLIECLCFRAMPRI
jgi:hypothetical protein